MENKKTKHDRYSRYFSTLLVLQKSSGPYQKMSQRDIIKMITRKRTKLT